MNRHVSFALLALRCSIGALMLVWGIDKFANPEHGVRVAERFYFGILSSQAAMPVLGTLQLLLGVLVIAGALRRWVYPVLAVVTGTTLVGVWRSILDPWGWKLEGTNALFFPSLTIFAAVLVLMALRDVDRLALQPYDRLAGNRGFRYEPT